MTAATTTATAPRPTLEELVDRIIEAIFGEQPPGAASIEMPRTSPARSIHEARRLKREGELDPALAVFAELDPSAASEGERRWAYAEFLGLARQRFRDPEALVYSPGAGRAAVLSPLDDRRLEVRVVLGMRWPTGQVVSRRSLRGLKPLARGSAS